MAGLRPPGDLSCPECGCHHGRVVDSRQIILNGHFIRLRSRECRNCGYCFRTKELTDDDISYVRIKKLRQNGKATSDDELEEEIARQRKEMTPEQKKELLPTPPSPLLPEKYKREKGRWNIRRTKQGRQKALDGQDTKNELEIDRPPPYPPVFPPLDE